MGRDRRRVLVTDDAYVAGLAAVRALRAAGYEPWVATVGGISYAGRSRATAGTVAVPDPGVDSEGFLRELATVVQRLDVAAILPGTDAAVTALAGQGSRFGDGVALGTCDPQVVRRATDKVELRRLAGRVGLGSPPTVAVDPGHEAEHRAELTFPAVVKPPESWPEDHRGERSRVFARRVDSFDQLRDELRGRAGTGWLVQPFLSGQLYGIAGVAWEGRLICSLHQLSRRIHPPDCGGSALAETVPADPALERAVAGLVEQLGWSGLFQLQLIRTGRTVHAIDFNPRIYGSLSLALAAGLNLTAVWVELLLGGEPRAGGYRYRPGVYYRAEEKDLRSLAAAVRSRQGLAALREYRPRRSTVHAVFSVGDPRPLLASLEKVRRALSVR
ncbi:MAG: carboxylate--amine ligase [Solirubrobacteraceae bacterium]